MNLYHYRSVESARKEIECRTFRYADRNELNDPLEGYAQIYWKGDCPAWEGLFRNYICSVYYAVVGIQLNASEELLAERAVIPDIHCFDDVPLGQVWKELSDRFVQTALVQKLIVDLGNTETEMNAHRLRQILRLCHEDAIKICLDDMHKRKSDMADEIYVINVGGYIGDSTRSEIQYAEEHGKPVRYYQNIRK